jgi:hypothetical protein
VALTRDGPVDDQRLQHLQAMGIHPQDAAAWLATQAMDQHAGDDDEPAPNPSEPFVVWPENWPVVVLFLRLAGEWRRTAAGRLDSIPVQAVEAGIRLSGLRPRAQIDAQLHEMERAARKADHGV